jgi:hypothetical protein
MNKRNKWQEIYNEVVAWIFVIFCFYVIIKSLN